MTMSLPVRVVLASGETFNRGRFSLGVMGTLVVHGKVSCIVDDAAAIDEIDATITGAKDVVEMDRRRVEQVDASIRIVDPTFLSRLSADVPPLPSGDFSYFDTVMICGSTRLEAGEVVLDDIWSISLYRDGKVLDAK